MAESPFHFLLQWSAHPRSTPVPQSNHYQTQTRAHLLGHGQTPRPGQPYNSLGDPELLCAKKNAF